MKATKSYLEAINKKLKIKNIMDDSDNSKLVELFDTSPATVYAILKGTRTLDAKRDNIIKEYIGMESINIQRDFTIKTYCKDGIIECETIDKETTALISIIDSNCDQLDFNILDRYNRSLTLFFDDIIHEPKDNSYDLILFNKSQYDTICRFIDILPDSINKIYVHCTAGVARSGAVALGIAIYKGNYNLLLDTLYSNSIHPNERVLSHFIYNNNPIHISMQEIFSELSTKREIKKEYDKSENIKCMNNGYLIYDSFRCFTNKYSAEYACKLSDNKRMETMEVVIDINN